MDGDSPSAFRRVTDDRGERARKTRETGTLPPGSRTQRVVWVEDEERSSSAAEVACRLTRRAWIVFGSSSSDAAEVIPWRRSERHAGRPRGIEAADPGPSRPLHLAGRDLSAARKWQGISYFQTPLDAPDRVAPFAAWPITAAHELEVRFMVVLPHRRPLPYRFWLPPKAAWTIGPAVCAPAHRGRHVKSLTGLPFERPIRRYAGDLLVVLLDGLDAPVRLRPCLESAT